MKNMCCFCVYICMRFQLTNHHLSGAVSILSGLSGDVPLLSDVIPLLNDVIPLLNAIVVSCDLLK